MNNKRKWTKTLAKLYRREKGGTDLAEGMRERIEGLVVVKNYGCQSREAKRTSAEHIISEWSPFDMLLFSQEVI